MNITVAHVGRKDAFLHLTFFLLFLTGEGLGCRSTELKSSPRLIESKNQKVKWNLLTLVRFFLISKPFQVIENASMEEPPSMAIKMDEASNTNSEENNESSSDGTMVSKVWISRQLVNHWFLNTVSLIFVRFQCLLFIINNLYLS